MGKIERNSKNFTLEDTNQIKIKGWLKVPRYVENLESVLKVWMNSLYIVGKIQLWNKYIFHLNTYPLHFFWLGQENLAGRSAGAV